MKPYYRDDQVTLFHGDCLEVRDWLDADVLVTDPPYGTQDGNGQHAGGYGRRQNYAGGVVGATIALDRTTETRDAVLALWGERPAIVFASPRLPEPPGVWNDRLVWDKRRPGMNGGPWRYRHESIFVRGTFERRSDASVSVLEAWPGSDQQRHIHAKPVPLMLSLVGVTDEHAVIADPFAGSGSTLVAAKQLGRRCVGVELDERYCEIIARRLAQGVLL